MLLPYVSKKHSGGVAVDSWWGIGCSGCRHLCPSSHHVILMPLLFVLLAALMILSLSPPWQRIGNGKCSFLLQSSRSWMSYFRQISKLHIVSTQQQLVAHQIRKKRDSTGTGLQCKTTICLYDPLQIPVLDSDTRAFCCRFVQPISLVSHNSCCEKMQTW